MELPSTNSTTCAGCTPKYVVKWVVPDGGSFSTPCATAAEVPNANDPATSAQPNNVFLMTHTSPKKIAAGRQPGGDHPTPTAVSRRVYRFLLQFYRLGRWN
jgi:hypothetical protein